MDDKLDLTIINADNTSSEQTLFMTYGLLNVLCEQVGGYDHIQRIDLDPELAGTIIMLCLIPRRPSGKVSVDLDQYLSPGLSVSEAEKILDWVKGHVLDFFLRRMAKTIELVQQRETQLTAISSSVNGSKLSALLTPSSSPSASAPAI